MRCRQASPGPVRCRRTEHDSDRHILKRPESSFMWVGRRKALPLKGHGMSRAAGEGTLRGRRRPRAVRKEWSSPTKAEQTSGLPSSNCGFLPRASSSRGSWAFYRSACGYRYDLILPGPKPSELVFQTGLVPARAETNEARILLAKGLRALEGA